MKVIYSGLMYKTAKPWYAVCNQSNQLQAVQITIQISFQTSAKHTSTTDDDVVWLAIPEVSARNTRPLIVW